MRQGKNWWFLSLGFAVAGGFILLSEPGRTSTPRTAAAQVTLGPQGELRVNGQPFLPIFVWLQPVRNFDFLISLGINTFMGEGAQEETAKEFLDAAQARGVWGIIHSREENWPLKGHPALLCWMFGDEPDLPAKQPYQRPVKVPRGDDGSLNIWWEGEQPAATNISPNNWMNLTHPFLSEGKWLPGYAEEIDQEHPLWARYEVLVPEAGIYHLWVREFTKNWASPSWWRFDAGPWQHTERDLKPLELRKVHRVLSCGWVPYGQVKLSAGRHVFEVKVDEMRTAGRPEKTGQDCMVAFDAFLLTTSDQPPLSPPRPPVPRVSPAQIAAQYRALKAVDASHPIYLNLTAGFYEQFARYDDATYRRYCQATDIVGYDLYPVTGWGKPEWVPLIGAATRKLRALASPRLPVWVILECTTKLRWVSQEHLNRIGHPQGARDFELRAMVWLAMVNGAKGIGYFPHRWDPYKQCDISEELQAEMKRTNRQLKELAPAILSPDAPEQVKCETREGGPVNFLTKKYQGGFYLFAVNTTREPARVRFTLPPTVRASKVKVYDEQREIAVQRGKFEDSFGELEVHIYFIPGE